MPCCLSNGSGGVARFLHVLLAVVEPVRLCLPIDFRGMISWLMSWLFLLSRRDLQYVSVTDLASEVTLGFTICF